MNGIIRSQNEQPITLQTQPEQVTFSPDPIDEIENATASLMPDGQLDPLQPDEIRDLVGYLMHRTQVTLPAGCSQ